MFTGLDANNLKNCLEQIVIIHEENAKANRYNLHGSLP
jgi:hypothetical protein